MIHEGAYEVKP